MGDAAVQETGKARGAFGKLKDSVFSVRGALTALGGAFVLRATLGVIRDFQTAMSGVRAVTGATEEQFAALSAEARLLGATTQFSAKEAAEGMRFLGQAGFDTNEILAATEPALRLAQAGMLDLAEAADIVSNIMSGFGIEAQETQRVADILAVTAANANTNIRQMGEAMKFVAPIAASTGQSIEDMAAAVGVLGDAGLQGSLAGAGLRTAILQLSAVTPVAEAAMGRLGLQIEDLDPTTNSFIDILKSLKEANIGAGDAAAIFGKRSAVGILALTQAIPRLEEMREKIGDSTGALDEMARIMEDNLNGSIRNMISVMQEAILQTGDAGLTGALRGAIDTITGVLRALTGTLDPLDENAKLFNALAISVQILTGALVGLALAKIATGMVSLAGGVLEAVKAVRGLTAAQTLLNVVMLANPIFLVAAAIGVAVAAYLVFRETARSATDAQTAFDDAIVQTEEALDAYQESLRDTSEELSRLSNEKLLFNLTTLQEEIKATQQDVENFTQSAIAELTSGEFRQAFAGGGLFGEDTSSEELKRIISELRQEFRDGEGDIEGAVARLQEFSQKGEAGAEAANDLAVALSDMNDDFSGATNRLEVLELSLNDVQSALAGTLGPAEDAALSIEQLAAAAEAAAALLDTAVLALEAFEEKARLSGLTAAERARELIQAETEALVAQLTAAGAELVQIERARAAGATQVANVAEAPGGGASAAETAAEKQAQQLRSLQDQFDLTGRAAREFADINEEIAELTEAGLLVGEERLAIIDASKAAFEATLDPLSTILGELDKEIALTGLSNEQRNIQNQLMQVEQELRLQGITLSADELATLEARLVLLQETGDAMTEGRKLTEELRTPTEAFADEIERLNELLDMEAISLETFGRASDAAAERLASATNKVGQSAMDVAEQSGQAAGKAFEQFLFMPFETGLKGMLAGFVDTLRQMASEALTKQIFSSLGGIGGGGGAGGLLGLVGSFFSGGAADAGGRGSAGEPVLIGSGAQPEAFIPDSAGTFVPRQQMNAMGGPSVNVASPTVNVAAPQVVVVDNEAKAEQLLQSAKGEEAVLSILRNNPQATRGAIGA